jgi:DNA replication protein DnaC
MRRHKDVVSKFRIWRGQPATAARDSVHVLFKLPDYQITQLPNAFLDFLRIPQAVPELHSFYTVFLARPLVPRAGKVHSHPIGTHMSATSVSCPICGDSGWKSVQGGKRVARCDCQTRVRVERLLALARIPARYQHCDFHNFQLKDNLEKAHFAAQRFTEEYPVNRRGLLFVGPIGVGKTHLAVSIIKRLISEKGIPCLFYDYRDLLKQIQDSYNPSVQTTEMELLRPALETEVLLLDELGAVKPTQWVWDTVSLLLNTRYNESRTTILTTNYPDRPAHRLEGVSDSPKERAQRAGSEESLGDRITDRMLSRLHEMCIKIEIQGSDFRQHLSKGGLR